MPIFTINSRGRRFKMPRLKDRYKAEVIPGLMKDFGYKNIMQVPKLTKIVINIGMGEATQNAKAMESAEHDVAAIAGQKPVITRAKRSISAFKIRKGMPIGIKVTLRGDRMWDFYDRLVSIVLPRIREFQGVPRDAFDGMGNYSLGFTEQTSFPEIEYEKIDKARGLEVSIVTTAGNDEHARRLLELLGMPFARE
jgi:large subunit ribosomal protein L5